MKRDPLLPLRTRIADEQANGPSFWRSREHKDGALDVNEGEFPTGTDAPTALQRRDVLKLAGASVALAGASACVRRPEEQILPYTHQPEEVIAGIPNFYATAQPRSDGAVGLVVEAHEGRPTKIEGNALHPGSLGASDVWAQAEILKLYDPDRARSPITGGKGVNWSDWDAFAAKHFAAAQGLAFLLEDDSSATVERLLAKVPSAQLFRFDPLSAANSRAATELVFGKATRAHFDLGKAKAVFALDSNFLVEGPDHIRMAKQWGQSRKSKDLKEARSMSRLYVAEGVFTPTGASADHRVRIASSYGKAILQALVGELAKNGVTVAGASSGAAPAGTDKLLAAAAKDLAKGGVVLVGERQPIAVHALAMAINVATGAQAAGVLSVTVPTTDQRASGDLEALTKALDNKAIQTLVIVDGNPAYTAPGALKMAETLKKAATVIHVGVSYDETAAMATWHLPMGHFLESWDDTAAWDGTPSIVQPLIMPLFGARSRVSLLAQMVGADSTDDLKLVQQTWSSLATPAWRQALHDGVIAQATRVAGGTFDAAPVTAALSALGDPPVLGKDNIEVGFMTSPVLDGRLANVSWTMELPDSMTKLCWDNALIVSPQLAREMGITSGVHKNSYNADIVTLTFNGASVDVPTFVLPGMAPYTAMVNLGFGRRSGEVAAGVGVDVTPLLPLKGRMAYGVKIVRTDRQIELCSTQDHFFAPASPMKELTFAQMSGASGDDRVMALGRRNIYRTSSLKMYEDKPLFAHEGDVPASMIDQSQNGSGRVHNEAHGSGEEQHAGAATARSGRPAMLKQPIDGFNYDGQQWGMVIDLTTCIGCSACTVACQAENNIPSVGKKMVLLGRELHWMRIDRYFTGDVDDPSAAHMPINCMHCENAPCEPVCPVSATVHDEEGLNAMAYNRCIGTRYCANNCPYKVRRFNYFDFTVTGNVYRNAHKVERMQSLKLQRNPNVTVRYRGVMEKCTYCTQRVEEAKMAAKRAGKDRKALPDGAITPACAQSCPTDAITFGNINDTSSRVYALKMSDRNYELLQELNVRPRTTFLARVKNTNPEVG